MKTTIICFALLSLFLAACGSATPQATPTIPHASATVNSGPTIPANQPWLSPRGYQAAAYDSHCDRVIVHGGESGVVGGMVQTLQDTWTYDLAANTWKDVNSSQKFPMTSFSWGDFSGGPIAYDEKADRTIFFDEVIMGSNEALANKTWAFDCSSNTWTNLNAKGAPGGLNGAGMVYDTKADRMILFGGDILPYASDNSWTDSNETWAYDFQANTWTDLHPKVSPPPGYNFFPMVYDPVSDRVLAWLQPNVNGNDTGPEGLWAYDYTNNTWTSNPIDKALFRIYRSSAYVSSIKKTFFFGGVDEPNETANNNLWTYDSAANTWAQLSPSTGPGIRGWTSLTYSPKADKLVLIGGGIDRSNFTSEVWIYDPQQGSWTKAGP